MTLKEWVKKNFGDLRLLPLSNFRYKPGAVLDPQTLEITSFAWSFFNETGAEPTWATERGPAQLAMRKFAETRKSGGRIKVPGIADIELSADQSITAEFTVEDVELMAFQLLTRSQLEKRLRTLKDAPEWLEIDDHPIIDECYYTKRLTVVFKREGHRLAKAEVAKLADISGGMTQEWKTDDTLEITGNAAVPFGVRDWRP